LDETGNLNENQLQNLTDKFFNLNFGPQIPVNYFFDNSSIKNFVLALLNNGLFAALSHHDIIRKQFQIPYAHMLQEFAQNFCPEWSTKLQNSFK